MIAGAYVLHLYCRFAPQSEQAIAKPGVGDQPPEYDARHRHSPYEPVSAQTFAQAKREARGDGWVFGRDGDVTCPVCVKHGPGIERIEKPSRGAGARGIAGAAEQAERQR